MRRSLPLLLGVAAAIAGLDQASKQWATAHLAYREPVHVLGDLVRLTYARNPGIAFSLFAGQHFPFYIFSIVASIAVLALFLRHDHLSWPRQLSLALILGGAVGNLIDRVATGEVVDFILLSWGRHEFPVFNVADIAVTTGVSLFALAWTREGDTPAATAEVESAHDTHGGPDGPAPGGGSAGGPLAGEGTDRPLA